VRGIQDGGQLQQGSPVEILPDLAGVVCTTRSVL